MNMGIAGDAGLGLAGMAERAALYGGTVSARPPSTATGPSIRA
ncbi:hypothetical protein [Actinoplanes sp. NPDC049118]